MGGERFLILGRIVDRKTGGAQSGVRVEAWDKERLCDRPVGSAVTIDNGDFRIELAATRIQELFKDRRPDLYFRVFRDGKLLASTEESVLWNVALGDTTLSIEIEAVLPPVDATALTRCDPGVRSLLNMSEQVIREAKERDLKRLAGSSSQPRPKFALSAAVLSAAVKYDGGVLPHPVYGAVQIERPTGSVRIRAIVDFAGNAQDLLALGIRVHSGIQNVFTITATRDQLPVLAAQAATRKIHLPRYMLPHLNEAVETAEIDSVHDRGQGGEGVIVGIVDGPLDVRHYAFRQPGSDATRVRFLWIQEQDAGASGMTPEAYFADLYPVDENPFAGLDYGILYDQAAIDAALALGPNDTDVYGTGTNQIGINPSFDDDGLIELAWRHGTGVASIAAGSGYRGPGMSDGVYIGGAPRADIVHVAQEGGEDKSLDAFRFIMAIGERESRPVVVNYSMGGNLGPHDGHGLFNVAMDALLDSWHGRAITLAACNYNGEGFRRAVVAPETLDVIRMAPTGDQDLWLDIWYRGPTLAYQVQYTDRWTPGGGDQIEWQEPEDGWNLQATLNDFDVSVVRDAEPGRSLHNIRVYIQGAREHEEWWIRLRNDDPTREVVYWAWVGNKGTAANLTGFTIDEMTLGDVACGRAPLAVGATNKPPAEGLETIWDRSGCGPTQDGRIKPEIAAVGARVYAALPVKDPDEDTYGVFSYGTFSGTSMAAPLVAGAVALLFEENPHFIQEAVKALLTRYAERSDLYLDPDAEDFEPIDRNRFGYGRLRMHDPYEHILPPGSVDVWVRTADDDYGMEPYPGDSFHRAPEVEVQVGERFDPSGSMTSTLRWGEAHAVRVRVHNLGDLTAQRTRVTLHYTRPWTAPSEWVTCQTFSQVGLSQVVEVPGLGYLDVVFENDPRTGNLSWIPQVDQVPEVDRDWGDHYCLLVEVDDPDDSTRYYNYSGEHFEEEGAREVWNRNIKGNNNVALRNLSIL